MAKNKNVGKKQPAQKSGGGKGFYLLVGGVVIAGGAALLMARDGGTSAPELAPPSVAETRAAPSADAGVAMGSPDAPVTIVEFADFLCPACRSFNAVTGKAIRRDFAVPGGPLRWINYDFPLNQASWAPALAARCADQQGRYWELHDLMYARVEDWAGEENPNGEFIDFAESLGMDGDAFRACLSDRSGLQEVGAARRYGESIGVNSTPTLFINGRRIPPTRQYYSYAGLDSLIQQMAAEAAPASEAQ